MTTEEKKSEIKKVMKKQEAETSQGGFAIAETKTSRTTRKFVNKKFDGSTNTKKRGGNQKSFQKPRAEFEQKIISMRRVTRVVAGGRRFSFSVGIVIGDKNGRVGVGMGKSPDTSLAIDKAIRDAKKNMISPNLTKTKSIPFDVETKYSASRVMMVPNSNNGLKAGGAMRVVLELLGAKDVTGKIFSRSKNHINNAKATIKALTKLGLKSKIRVEVPVEKSKTEKVL